MNNKEIVEQKEVPKEISEGLKRKLRDLEKCREHGLTDDEQLAVIEDLWEGISYDEMKEALNLAGDKAKTWESYTDYWRKNVAEADPRPHPLLVDFLSNGGPDMLEKLKRRDSRHEVLVGIMANLTTEYVGLSNAVSSALVSSGKMSLAEEDHQLARKHKVDSMLLKLLEAMQLLSSLPVGKLKIEAETVNMAGMQQVVSDKKE